MVQVKCEKPLVPGTCCCNCKWLKPARCDFGGGSFPPFRDRWICWDPELDYAVYRNYEHSLCEMWEERVEDGP